MTLLDALSSGLLVRPRPGPDLVQLSRAVATVCGVPDLNPGPSSPVSWLVELIGTPDHLIFVLLDGLGMNLVEQLPSDSFIASHLAARLNSTCPSTTACALTSLTTAAYPSRHGVTGWFTYLPEFGLTAALLPFQDRFTCQPLTQRGILAGQVLPIPPVTPRMNRQVLTVVPSSLCNTTYNEYSRGGTRGLGYQSIPHAVDLILAALGEAHGKTYTHLYLPEVDSRCHHRGTGHPEVLPLVLAIDAELARLHRANHPSCRMVLCADHGLIDVPIADQAILRWGDPLLDLLIVPPTGDARMPIFHVKQGKQDEFQGAFEERFGDRMILTPVAECEELGLFGPPPMSPIARARFGDFIAFPFRAATLGYEPPDRPSGHPFLAVHGGLSPQEMRIPLCIA